MLYGSNGAIRDMGSPTSVLRESRRRHWSEPCREPNLTAILMWAGTSHRFGSPPARHPKRQLSPACPYKKIVERHFSSSLPSFSLCQPRPPFPLSRHFLCGRHQQHLIPVAAVLLCVFLHFSPAPSSSCATDPYCPPVILHSRHFLLSMSVDFEPMLARSSSFMEHPMESPFLMDNIESAMDYLQYPPSPSPPFGSSLNGKSFPHFLRH